jgi:dihydrofolate synthase / folylpolyglutamate synthase
MFRYNYEMITPPLESKIYALIESLQHARDKATIVPFVELLDRLGNPHHRLPKVIHVAGTNGKGSVLAYLDSILRTAKLKIHRYTSPHLVSICERIQVADHLISPQRFLSLLQEIAPHTAGLPLTYFDLITAVAFLEFSRVPADYLLLETGLGGRYDATNVIASPLFSVITQIGMDHMDLLGSDLRNIAREKAGIIKHGAPVITLPHETLVMDVIASEAENKDSKLIIADENEHFEVALLGPHQQQNASLAVAVARQLGCIPDVVIREGLRKAYWPGRMQQIDYCNRLVWLDMAHNASAAEVASLSMKALGAEPFHLIFSLRKSKDLLGFMRAFKGRLLSVIYIPMSWYVEGHHPDDVQEIADDLHMDLRIMGTIYEALRDLPDEPVLITGSAMLVGDALLEADHQKNTRMMALA